MKIPWYIRTAALLLFLFLACLLKRSNDAASNGQKEYSIPAFNRSAPEPAGQIAAYWRADPFRLAAIRTVTKLKWGLLGARVLPLLMALLPARWFIKTGSEKRCATDRNCSRHGGSSSRAFRQETDALTCTNTRSLL